MSQKENSQAGGTSSSTEAEQRTRRGSAAHSVGMPRRPQSVPPPSSSVENAYDTRLYSQERLALSRHNAATAGGGSGTDKGDNDGQLFFVTEKCSSLVATTQRHAAQPGGSVEPVVTASAPSSPDSTLSQPPQTTAGESAAVTGSGNEASVNLYTSITQAMQASALDFRKCTAPESFPADIMAEESAGIFMGQLPSSYSEEDIECLLRALGRMHGKLVHVRDVKSHVRDRTCAFVMVNVSSVSPIIDFSKRVLCDINNVWVVSASQSSAIISYINNIPRHHLRGVPKLPLVLERLTHGGRGRRESTSHAATRELARASEQAMPPSQMRVDMSAAIASGHMTHVMPMTMADSRRLSADSTGSLHSFPAPGGTLQPFSMVPAPGQLYPAGLMPVGPRTSMFGVPAAMPQGGAYQPMMPQVMETEPNPSHRQSLNSRVVSFGEPQQQRQSLTSHSQMNSEGVDGSRGSSFSLGAPMATFGGHKFSISMGDGGEMASVSCQSHGLSGPFLSTQLGESSFPSGAEPMSRPSGGGPISVASIPTVLPSISCSCGQYLRLSVTAMASRCARCQNTVDANAVSYWCPSAHLCVCTNCGMRIAFSSPFPVPHADPARAQQ